MSAREVEVLLAASDGLTDREIASRLRISKGTITSYWNRVRRKLGSHTRSKLLAIVSQDLDISKVLRLEARAKALLRLIPEPVVVVDGEGTILEVFDSEQRPLIISRKMAIGRPVGYLGGPEIIAQSRRMVRAAIESGKTQLLEATFVHEGIEYTCETRFISSGADEVFTITRFSHNRPAGEQASA